MLRKLISPIAVLLSFHAFSQGVGINNPTPHASALLDLTSTNKGLLVPRMTTVQRDGVPLPATSLLIYNTTNARFEFFNGSAWVPLVVGGGTLDQAYDFGGPGAGRTITADAGAMRVDGTDGLQVTGTLNSGATLDLAGAGVRMFFYPRKAAFRAGNVFGTQWDDANIGVRSVAFGSATASGQNSFASGGSSATGLDATALGNSATASGMYSISMGYMSNASSIWSTAIGYIVSASGGESTSIGSYSTASGYRSVALGCEATASGSNAKSFSHVGSAFSYGETALGIGPTNYTPSTNGATEFRVANATDRLLVVGNAIDANNNNSIDAAERSNAFLILKNGNTAIGNINPTTRLDVDGQVRIRGGNPAAGRVLMGDATGLATWVDPTTTASGTLDQAYDFGGAGAGRTISADAGAVRVDGTDGLQVTGTLNSGATLDLAGGGVRMFFYPRKAAFRAGGVPATEWNDANIGSYSAAWGEGTTASATSATAWGRFTEATGPQSTVWGSGNIASGGSSTAFGNSNTASGNASTCFGGGNNTASGVSSMAWGLASTASATRATAWGEQTIASGELSTTWGLGNQSSGLLSTAWGRGVSAPSFAETTLGHFSSTYTPLSILGINANDRLFAIGNGLSDTQRSNALLILKNGFVAIGNITPTTRLDVDGQVRIRGGNPAAGRVLVGDATGLATWVDPTTIPTNAWGLTGNAGTAAGNFVGTTDAQPLRLRVNNQAAGLISNANTGMLSLGLGAGAANTGTNNTFIGQGAGAANAASGNNTYVGTNAGALNTNGQENVFIGRSAGGNGNTGSSNILIGNGAGLMNTANNNVMIGSFAGNANTTGGGNTFLGIQAGQSNSTGGQNTFMGGGAGLNVTTGQGLTLVGNSAMTGAPTLTNATAIGFMSQVDVSNALVLGSVAGVNGATVSANVGIGTSTPARRLHVATGVSGATSNANTALVVEGDAATYQHFLTPSTAESGIIYGTEAGSIRGGLFFNNTNATDGIQFRTGGNATRMTLTSGGNLGIGTNTPARRLHVATGVSGAASAANTALVVEAAGAAYQHFLTPSANESGLLYGTEVGSIRGGIIFNNTSVADGIQFRTGGNNTRMSITDAGLVGIGTTAPTTRLQVNGAVALTPPAVVIVNTAGFTYDPGDRSYVRLNSTGTPSLRVVTLVNGLSVGQMLVVECTATGGAGFRFNDSANMNVSGPSRDLTLEDTITFIWNGTKWLELSYADN